MRFSVTKFCYVLVILFCLLFTIKQIIDTISLRKARKRFYHQKEKLPLSEFNTVYNTRVNTTIDPFSKTIYNSPFGFNVTRISLKNPGKVKNWEDSQYRKEVKNRIGPGENGNKVALTIEEEKLDKESYGSYGYSKIRSDKIALDRTIPDTRSPECKHKQYYDQLPNVSVILPFHNEAMSVLLRSATSIVNRSPENLIQEIIFVDDLSDHPDLTDDNFEKVLVKISPKIKVVRSKERIGLIQGRVLGAESAKAEVFVFLDSHVEVNHNWLPPLLHQIALNYRAVVQPTIEGISEHNFGYRSIDMMDGLRQGSFDWLMTYKRFPIPQVEEKKRRSAADPFITPVHNGGIFAIHSQWWRELKGYDPFLDIWIAEQFEMSFKTWMCHGEMLEIPCSRVARVYRGHMTVPFTPRAAIERSMSNMPRIAEVWMDEYKEYFYSRKPDRRFSRLMTGIEDRFEIRQRLQCNSFDWYMKNVNANQMKHFPPVEPSPYARGKVRNQDFMMKCINRDGNFIALGNCEGAPKFAMTWKKEFAFEANMEECLDMGYTRKSGEAITPGLEHCHKMGGNQFWKLTPQNKQIRHILLNQCLTTDGALIFVEICKASNSRQQWVFDELDMSQYRPNLYPLDREEPSKDT